MKILSFLVDAVERKTRGREAPPWESIQGWFGSSERANAKHDESKHGKTTKGEPSCCQSKQDAEEYHRQLAAFAEREGKPDTGLEETNISTVDPQQFLNCQRKHVLCLDLFSEYRDTCLNTSSVIYI